jgi:hypothetical protein
MNAKASIASPMPWPSTPSENTLVTVDDVVVGRDSDKTAVRYLPRRDRIEHCVPKVTTVKSIVSSMTYVGRGCDDDRFTDGLLRGVSIKIPILLPVFSDDNREESSIEVVA